MSIYRRIYTEHFGPIPKGYHIHHKDGNHSNNDPLNLVAITAKEHYDIHFSQGDYGACWAMYRTGHMTLTSEERSALVSKQQKMLLESNKHPFQDQKNREKIRQIHLDKISKRTHHLQSGSIQRIQNAKRILEGTHNLLGENNPIHERVEKGLHQEMMKNENKKRLANGTHNFTMKWICPICGKSGTNQTNYSRWHGDRCRENIK